MKKIIILSIVLFVAFTIKVSAQNKRVYTSSNSSTITIGTPANRTVYGGTIINSMYHGNLINPKIKGMFEYACKLWEENIPTAYPINLDVRFENLPDGCLAKVTTEPADSIYHDKVFIKRYKQLYSIEKNSINSLEYMRDSRDALITFSSKNVFEFTRDSILQNNNKYDFVTVALQAIGMALGFSLDAIPNNNSLEELIPCNKYTSKILTDNASNNYILATSGQAYIRKGDSGPIWYLYCPSSYDDRKGR